MNVRTMLLTATVAALAAGPVSAQDLHIGLPADSLDFLLRSAEIGIEGLTGTRFQGDRTDRATLIFEDGTAVMAQLAPAPRGGEEFNNVPRYELAAYDLQRLYLEEPELVVPPTSMRAFDVEWYRQLDGDVEPTLRGTRSVIVLIQSWVNFTTDEDVWDEDRFEADPLYARHWANLNLFTHLIRHSDSNTGNVRVSNFPTNPRLFAVDNGVAFNSIDSDRGTRWRSLLVDRFPANTVARLRQLTEQQLHDALGVMVQWEIEDDLMVPVPKTENIDARRGVRQRDGVVQFGLTRDEIDDIWYRVEVFLGQIDNGTYTTF
jgi:hypothetical protein